MMKCAFYEKEITPPLGFNMPGYFNFRPGNNVADRLYAKAFILADEKEKIAIVTVDACEPVEFIREAIVQRVVQYMDIKKENIVFSVNHTHTGIPDGRDFVTEGYDEYIQVACSLMADCIILANMRLQECDIFYGLGKVEGISFVRDYYMKNSTPKTNPGRLNPEIIGPTGEVDTELPVLLFKNKEGKALGSFVSYACHQDCIGGDSYSGDFSSIVSNELKKVWGNDYVSMFLLGTCGNINHFDVTKAEDVPEHYIKMGKIIAEEALRIMRSAKPLCSNVLSCSFEILDLPRYVVNEKQIEEAKRVIETVKPAIGVKIAADGTDTDQYNLAMAKILMNFVTGPEVIKVPLQVLIIGELVIYIFPGEIYSEYGKSIKTSTKADKCMVVTMCNKRIGYVPTKDMYYDTIYESLPGACMIQKDGGDKMVNKILQMSNALLKG